MTSTFSHPRDSANWEHAARGIGESLREAAASSVTPDHLAAEADRLRRVVAQSISVPRNRLPLRFILAAAVVGSCALVGVLVFTPGFAPGFGTRFTSKSLAASPLTVDLVSMDSSGAELAPRVGQPLRIGEQSVVSSDSGRSLLRFSDGTRVRTEVGSRLRVVALFPDGATLLLEKGRADVAVVHRGPDTRWSIAAGPFSVAITGTKFDVGWEPAQERLIVELREGRVEVSGPKFASPASLKAGQRFEALSSERQWRITPLGVPNSIGTQALPWSATQAAPVGAPVPTETTSEPTASAMLGARGNASASANLAPHPAGPPEHPQAGIQRKTEATVDGRGQASQVSSNLPPTVGAEARPTEARQWPKLVASGEFRQVTREADAMGLMVCLAQCSPSDLRALADASRYTGRLDTAEAALRELYTRFPGQANTATYLLGVVDEARGRNASALRWYNEYLSRVPNGGVVAEARAAKIRMLVATGGNVAAEKAAREYLESYPKGAASGLARRVLEGR